MNKGQPLKKRRIAQNNKLPEAMARPDALPSKAHSASTPAPNAEDLFKQRFDTLGQGQTPLPAMTHLPANIFANPDTNFRIQQISRYLQQQVIVNPDYCLDMRIAAQFDKTQLYAHFKANDFGGAIGANLDLSKIHPHLPHTLKGLRIYTLSQVNPSWQANFPISVGHKFILWEIQGDSYAGYTNYKLINFCLLSDARELTITDTDQANTKTPWQKLASVFKK
jgi:hypothetical protein